MTTWAVIQLAGSGIALSIMFALMLMGISLNNQLEGLHYNTAKSCFLWVGLFFLGFFLWAVMFIANFLYHCRKNPHYFQNTLKRYGIMSDKSPVDLQYDVRIKQLEEEISNLKDNIKYLEEQILQSN